jgi:hypothetical protein
MRRPLSASVMSEALAVEIAQPTTRKLASRITPSSILRYTVILSPHSGL